MSGSRPQHLQRRAGTYHLRVRVPADLRVRLGLREIRRSLRVHSLDQARPLALKYAARLTEVFEMIRAQDLTRLQAQRLSQACFRNLAAEVDQCLPLRTDNPDLEQAEQLSLWAEFASDVQAQLDVQRFSAPVTTVARRQTDGFGLPWDEIPDGRQLDILTGVARAMLEQHRLFLFRMEEQLLAYEPRDPLFQSRAPATVATPTPPPPEKVQVGPLLADVARDYLDRGKRDWTAKTFASREKRIGFLTEHLGGDRPITSVTPADIRGYADAVCRLRNTRAPGMDHSFAARQTENEEHRISPKTAALIYETAQAFFRWAKTKRGYIAVNPAEDVKLDVPSGPKSKRPRRPFTEPELQKLFSAPLFTGSLSVNRRFDPGEFVMKDARYWLPILGYYTGARLGELVQLHLCDVITEGPLPFISITDAGSGKPGSDDYKSVKSVAGVRRVPLHPDLIDLGFARFVQHRLKEKRASKRLFWSVSLGADGQASTTFSKWFARFLDKTGLKDPALVFHSFRHSAEDAFRDALLPQYVIDRVIGHDSGLVSAGYGEGISLEVAYDAVKVMKLKVRVPEVLGKG